MNKKVKGYIQKNIPPEIPGFDEDVDQVSAFLGDLNEIKEELKDTLKEAKQVVKEAKKISEEALQKVDDKIESLDNTALEMIRDIKNIPTIKGENGKDGNDGFSPDENRIVATVLNKFPKIDEGRIIRGVLERMPRPKSETKIIRESVTVDPMSVIDKILALPEDKFKLKTSHIDGLEQTMSAFRNQIANRGYLHGGGDTVVAGTNITITTNANGTKTINATGGGGTVGPGVTNEIAYFTSTTTIGSLATATYPSLTELSYLKGVTSSIQTQLNAKGVGTVTSVSGTTDRITSTGGATPVIDISATFEALLGKVANPLSQFASTTSLQLAGVISDETGSGSLVFGTSPTLTTSLLMTSGFVLNFNAGNVTITHSAGTLTFNNTAIALGSGAITTTGNVTGNNWLGTTAVRAGASSFFYWNGLARMYSPSDGVIRLSNDANTDFGRLQFGGTTSSFPAIKRSSAILQARLADDSAYTDLEVADEAYGVGWNGSLEVPTKNAVYDKIETLSGGGANTALSNLASVAINTTLVSDTNNTDDLGTTAVKWANLYVTNIGATATRIVKGWFTDLEVTNAPTLNGVAIPSISSTNTLTNKRITKRVLALSAGSATPAINTDSYDVVHITAQSSAITSFTSSLTGTPVDGDTLRISITDNGTARALTWGASFEASTVALPTTTVISTRLDVGFIWNTETTKWRCVAVA